MSNEPKPIEHRVGAQRERQGAGGRSLRRRTLEDGTIVASRPGGPTFRIPTGSLPENVAVVNEDGSRTLRVNGHVVHKPA